MACMNVTTTQFSLESTSLLLHGVGTPFLAGKGVYSSSLIFVVRDFTSDVCVSFVSAAHSRLPLVRKQDLRR